MPSQDSGRRLAGLLGLAAAYAGVELGLGLLLGRFFAWGRAEALIFHAYRPWLLLCLALVALRFDLTRRAALYAAALLLAGISESLLLVGLGAADPWPEMLRALAAGAVLVVIADTILHVGARLFGVAGRWTTALLLIVLLITVGGRFYERLLIGEPPIAVAADKPDLLMMSALPIVWGEGGAFDPASRPAAAYLALQRVFNVRPIDVLSPETLSEAGLMLLAQPRALAPEELVALDDWVRSGGKVLILTDPALVWPTALPLGDVRRPPPVALLHPLLSHWGLELHASETNGVVIDHFQQSGARRRLTLAAPGRLTSRGESCVVDGRGYAARCRIGRGRALLLADADLLRDSMWVAPVDRGEERHARIADNPFVLIHWLDRLAGLNRRAEAPVEWLSAGANRSFALLLALLPITALGAAAASLYLRRRRS